MARHTNRHSTLLPLQGGGWEGDGESSSKFNWLQMSWHVHPIPSPTLPLKGRECSATTY
ncbi:MAG: hypothetical protein Q8O31_08030 [Rhodocyclaceae bacterium]|nr:hypothetical protein [Rhodocyclaceae bacterium]